MRLRNANEPSEEFNQAVEEIFHVADHMVEYIRAHGSIQKDAGGDVDACLLASGFRRWLEAAMERFEDQLDSVALLDWLQQLVPWEPPHAFRRQARDTERPAAAATGGLTRCGSSSCGSNDCRVPPGNGNPAQPRTRQSQEQRGCAQEANERKEGTQVQPEAALTC